MALLALLPLLTLLALLPLLALLALLPLPALARPLAHALVERLQPARDLLRPVERVAHRIGPRVAN